MERRFVLYSEPHASDPAWINPVIEVMCNPANGAWEITKPMSDAKEVSKAAKEIESRIMHREIFDKAAASILKAFGKTPDEYITLVKAQREKEKANAKPIANDVTDLTAPVGG